MNTAIKNLLVRSDNLAGWTSEASVYLQHATKDQAIYRIMTDIAWHNSENPRRQEAKVMIKFLTNVVQSIITK